jgi:hypothetical protein
MAISFNFPFQVNLRKQTIPSSELKMLEQISVITESTIIGSTEYRGVFNRIPVIFMENLQLT